jgi:hypothetical protein
MALPAAIATVLPSRNRLLENVRMSDALLIRYSRTVGAASAREKQFQVCKENKGQAKAQCHILFPEPGIRQELWGRFLTWGWLVTRPNSL